MSFWRGALLFLAMALLFLTANRGAYKGYFNDDDLDNLVQKGADLEKVVLSRAVKWHIDNRILVYGNKTVVFD